MEVSAPTAGPWGGTWTGHELRALLFFSVILAFSCLMERSFA